MHTRNAKPPKETKHSACPEQFQCSLNRTRCQLCLLQTWWQHNTKSVSVYIHGYCRLVKGLQTQCWGQCSAFQLLWSLAQTLFSAHVAEHKRTLVALQSEPQLPKMHANRGFSKSVFSLLHCRISSNRSLVVVHDGLTIRNK